jgi:large subunit ribosomal protein L25
MSEIVLNAKRRDPKVKRPSVLRREGFVPGIFYAHGEENLAIAVDPLSLHPLIHTSQTNIVTLQLEDGTAKKCILRDVQFDPVSDRPLHFDLLGLRENEELTIEVPVVLTGGTAAGVKEGGTLQHAIHRLRISCLPKYIPSKIEVDVSALAINDSVHVKDLKIENVTVLENEDSAVVGVLPPTVEKAPVEAAVVAEVPEEPEVLAKGKKVEEGEAPAAEEKKK